MSKKFSPILAAAVAAAAAAEVHPPVHASGVPIQLIAAADGSANKLPRFKINAYTGGMMMLAGWYRPVVVDLSGVKAAKSIAVLRQHDPGRIVGHSDSVEIDKEGIRVEGVVSGTAEDAQEVTASSKNGFPWQASIGANPDRVEFLAEGKKATVNGQEFTGPLNIVRACTLYEVSFVPIGADSNTSANVAAKFSQEIAMEFEAWLKANGFDATTLTDERKAVLKAMFEAKSSEAAITALKASWKTPEPATTNKPGTQPSPQTEPIQASAASVIEANRTALAAEANRVAKIEELCGKKYNGIAASALATIKANAIKDGWTSERTELEIVRADRPQAPAGHVPENTINANILEAAVCSAGKLSNAEKLYDDKTLQAAHSRFRRGISLQEMLLEAAYMNGYTGRGFRGNEREVLKAAFSSINITNILSNVANKFLLEGWMTVEDTWRQISAIRAVNDFKTITSYRLVGTSEYQQVAPTGELKHGTLSDESFTNKADTYGLMLAITRQDQINDDLGALTQVPKMLGRGGALKFNKVFWAAFMDNSDFFKSDNANYQSGSGTALSIDSLTAAELLFLNQTDSDGNPLGLAGSVLLTPNALATKATSLTRDTEIRDTTASTKYTTSNPHAGKWKPVRSSYLSNATLTGYSALAWYLLADPASLATIEACFLNGQQNPTIETAEADFNTLGIQMRGYHDFGVTKQEFRAGVKSKGEA